MSTKIYNAFRFEKPYIELLPFLKQVREDIEKDTVEFYRSHRNHKRKADALKLVELFEKAQKTSAFEFNVESCVVVYFHKTEIYLHFFYPGHFGRSDKGFPEKWSGYISDFHYQNQSYRPENISEKEWIHRDEVWNEIIGYYEPPSRAGLVWNINNELFNLACEILK